MTDISSVPFMNESDFRIIRPDGAAFSLVEDTACQMAISNPSLGPYSVSDRLRELGIMLSPAKVRSIWKRHELETCDKRLTALTRELVAVTCRKL